MQHDHREIAQALLRKALNGETSLTSKAGQFLGGLSFAEAGLPLSERQREWLSKLEARHGGKEAGDD